MEFQTKKINRCSEMKLIPIPYSFIRKHLNLSWKETLWGYEHKLIGWLDVVSISEHKLLLGSDIPEEIKLACLGKSDIQETSNLLHVLASNEQKKRQVPPRETWLFLSLYWLFEQKNTLADPLEEVAKVYSYFDYPAELESFIHYMPVAGAYNPGKHSAEENKARLVSKWNEYIIQRKDDICGNQSRALNNDTLQQN